MNSISGQTTLKRMLLLKVMCDCHKNKWLYPCQGQFEAPSATKRGQIKPGARWIPTPYATYTQGKHAHSWNWRLPKARVVENALENALQRESLGGPSCGLFESLLRSVFGVKCMGKSSNWRRRSLGGPNSATRSPRAP